MATVGQTDRQAGERTNGQTDRRTQTQTQNRHRHRQTQTQTATETDRDRDRDKTDMDTDTDTNSVGFLCPSLITCSSNVIFFFSMVSVTGTFFALV